MSLRQFDHQISQKLQDLNAEELKECKLKFLEGRSSQQLFKDKCVKFYYRIPNFRQRMMLFEKIHFMVEKHFEKKQRMVRSHSSAKRPSHSTDGPSKAIDEYMDFHNTKYCFKDLIGLIRNAYLSKTKENRRMTEGSL